MTGKTYKWTLAAAAAALFCGVSVAQWGLTQDRERLGLNRYTELRGAPPVLALTTVALGGFRGLISNALWMRATALQDQDKYFEMVQLADWITKLEPHIPQVWLMQSWNMSFNISVKFSDWADRWRWVERGMELLRDEGLKYNPYDVPIHHELAWLFQFKMGDNMDDAQEYYKYEWAKEMQQVFKGDRPDWDELIHPATDDARRRSALLREKYKMDPVLMKQVDDKYGPLEWRLPEAHAIYWAVQGLEMAKKNEQRVDPDTLIQLHRIIYQSMQLAFRRGRLIRMGTNTDERTLDLGPNLTLVAKVNDAYEEWIGTEEPKYHSDLTAAHHYFLLDAIYFFQTYGREQDATRWYDYYKEKYPDKPMLVGQSNSLPGKISLEDYTIGRVEDELKTLGQYKTGAVIEGLERQSLMSLAVGDDDRATAMEALANRFWNSYLAKIDRSSNAEERLTMRSPKQVRHDLLNELLTPGVLPPDAAAILATSTGQTNLPATAPTAPVPAKSQ
jgi:hypothetical protein